MLSALQAAYRALNVPDLSDFESGHSRCFGLGLSLDRVTYFGARCFLILSFLCLKDFALHAQKCSELLAHYTAQWRDREVYWAARDRSALHGDLLTLIVDSFDRSKLFLPRFPFNRTPKRPIYQTCQKSLALVQNSQHIM